VIVRRAKREDAPILLRLIAALAEFEELTPPDTAAQERLLRDGWPEDTSPRFTAWIAEIETEHGGAEAAGYAITFETYSSFLALPTLYIEDIFVLPSQRRRTVGSALMRRLIQEAWETGCGRMEWVVLDWNTSAQQFYRRFGANHLHDWQYYRLRREEMPAALEPPNDSADTS
jgi:GNAT superfamily N-acetyltransferase